ncbi:PHD and RING finger domain-containing protein 1 isoform X1 [Echeneis naucrates]|uniref:PHD and RING finger domain-containing protein 1 isoform X1 n=1 Tax=Echeneis naucrates TaxID=173247 RepID=UPI0011138ECB|nr:PHD and RING finger domain-containing protein 1 isoform X1 [Echeneis naucrates]XP_029378046.1 PHD and RING finger domain-containing protein 1 isoform X1 [Echeneis naucrates]
MDEDDSQDELINPSATHSKGKRASLWAISDDSDDAEESEEGESDSDEEDHLDGEDDDEEEEEGNEEENDEEVAQDAKPEDGALEGASADLAWMSSDEESETCPICLNSFTNQPVATPENCQHYFCLDCILEWAKNANLCPIDRIAFNSIYLRKCFGGKVKKMITIQKPVKEGLEDTVDLDLEQTSCEVCGGSDREDRLLLCDGCDAGYHMECLTPPLDSVPVEEWFCPGCEANNRHLRSSGEEHSEAESLPSIARSTPSLHQSRVTGPTRAIARTQQSERVRANVNRHRITQARTSQLAPTYLIQSTWLDETINAVVAGLNTAVYIRDLTHRAPSRCRRTTGKRRKVKRKNTSAKGKSGKAASTGARRKKRRRTKSRKKMMLKNAANPRSRIASNIGIVKGKKSSSLPTVYRPSEHTLSSMRADIGAASLSIYGDPFDLDPFADREEDEQQAHATSLLEAKRRGISRSALRSHQPVARPVNASLSRRAIDVPQSGSVVQAAPVPDLLGSILSGQSMLLMDSSDVVINRDGSLKASKPAMPSTSEPVSSKSSHSEDAGTQINGDLPRSSSSSMNRPLSQSSACLQPFTPYSGTHIQPPSCSDMPLRSLQPTHPNRHSPSVDHRGANGIKASRQTTSASIHSSQSQERAPSHSHSKKTPTKPMWVDVSVLPRIPKIRRESSGATSDGNRKSSSRESSNNSASSGNGYGMPEMGISSLAGEKTKQPSGDQQKGRAEGQAQRHRSDGAGSSSAFSNSFSSSSSSSTGTPATQSVSYSSSSSSSAAVSFRINSSGNSWHSRRLSIASSSVSGDSLQQHWRQKENEAKKRQLHRDKQMLLASRTLVNQEKDSNNIYDPFNPTLSDSNSSDAEAESLSLDSSSRNATHKRKSPALGNEEDLLQSKQYSVHVKSETQETELSQEQTQRSSAQESTLFKVRCSQEYLKDERESKLDDVKIEEQTIFPDIEVKKEPGLDDAGGAERCGRSVKTHQISNTAHATPLAHPSPALLKTEKKDIEEVSQQREETPKSGPLNCKRDSSATISTPTEKKRKAESDSDFTSCSKSPSRDLGGKKKPSKAPNKQCSSSSEMDRGRKTDRHSSGQGVKQKEKKARERTSRRSTSKQKRWECSTSDSSQSKSPDRTSRKRRRSRSHSEGRWRSRSYSSSSSRERSRKKHQRRSKERNDGRERDHERRRLSKEKRHGRSHSRSRSRSRSTFRSKDNKRDRSCSKSRSRSRSKERRKDCTQLQQQSTSSRDKLISRSKDKRRHRSRSSSREPRKEEGRSSTKSSQKSSASCAPSPKDTKQLQDRKREKCIIQSSLKEEKTCEGVQEPSWTSTSKVKKECKDSGADSNVTPAEVTEEIKTVKEIKKEEEPFIDMFEDFSVATSIKKEEKEFFPLSERKGVKEEGIKEELFKTETCENTIIKSEPSSPQVCHFQPVSSFSSLTTPAIADSHQSAVPHSHAGLMASTEQTTTGLTANIKQEVQQPSDSDDDFNVDVILDNLDYMKSEQTEASDAFVKKEKAKNEGEQVLAVVGAKSKTQVKRVTWNIQEHVGPEKSASKVAMYKLKLKQEGIRRPSLTVQTTSQHLSGAVNESSKKTAVCPLASSVSSRPDGPHSGGLSITVQGVSEEGDLSRKDKYLKKLHMQERAIEEVKLAIKPFYQRRDINKDEYKEILRKAVQKVCHSKSGEINPVKVGNLVKAYVDKYKHARKHRKAGDLGKASELRTEALKMSDSP